MFRIRKINPVPWMIGSGLIAIGKLGYLFQTMPGSSALERSQYYMSLAVLDGLSALGSLIVAITAFVLVVKMNLPGKCPLCGQPVNKYKENFCRTCGEKL